MTLLAERYSVTAASVGIVIRRERDAELINSITNDPAVLPFISRHGGEIDWSPAVAPCVILSNGEDAAMVLERTAERDWQVNTMFAPTCRGKRAVKTGMAMKDWMFPDYADLIFGSIPKEFRHARWFYHRLGGREVERVESGGDVYEAQPGEVLFALRGNC
jgi:hypothetical protein